MLRSEFPLPTMVKGVLQTITPWGSRNSNRYSPASLDGRSNLAPAAGMANFASLTGFSRFVDT